LICGVAVTLITASPAAAQGLLDANCPGPASYAVSTGGDSRFAQTFAVQTTGSLVRGEVEIEKGGNPGGNWVMQMLATDAIGNPTNTVLASTTIADASVPSGRSRLAGSFSSPPGVEAGRQYALAITRPGAGQLKVWGRNDNLCLGDQFLSYGPSAPWGYFIYGLDNVFAVYVKPPNAFTVGRAALNRRRGTATLTVNIPFAGELTASGKGVRSASAARAVTSKSVPAGAAQLLIRAVGKKKRKLNETGKVKLNVAVTYTPTGGDPATQSLKLRLKKV
jgi:hypothetical protein